MTKFGQKIAKKVLSSEISIPMYHHQIGVKLGQNHSGHLYTPNSIQIWPKAAKSLGVKFKPGSNSSWGQIQWGQIQAGVKLSAGSNSSRGQIECGVKLSAGSNSSRGQIECGVKFKSGSN